MSPHPPGLVGLALRHRWRWILGLTALVGLGLTLLLDGTAPRSYTRTQTYLVASVAAPERQLVSANTDRAARDYAVVLRGDDLLLADLARAAGESVASVRSSLSPSYSPATSTIAVGFHAATAGQVRALFNELDRLVAADGIGSFPPGFVRPLRQDQATVVSLRPGIHPAIGLLGGLLVGLVVALLLERSRPSLTTPAQLRAATALPVVELDGSATPLRALATSARADVLHVLATAPDIDAEEVAAAVRRAAPDLDVRPGAGEEGALTLLLARQGQPVRTVEAAIGRLEGQGVIVGVSA